jgi:hypothetical protein
MTINFRMYPQWAAHAMACALLFLAQKEIALGTA